MHPSAEFHWRRLLSRLHRARVVLASRGWNGARSHLLPGNVPAPGEGPQASSPVPPRESTGPRLLILDGSLPEPDRDSGSLRLVNLIRLLQRMGFVVDFLAEDGGRSAAGRDVLQALGVALVDEDWRRSPGAWLRRVPPYAAAVVCRYHASRYWTPLFRRCSAGTRVVLDTVDLHFVRERREAEVRGSRSLARAARATERLELLQVQAADVTWVVSDVERALLHQRVPGACLEVVSNLHAADPNPAGFGSRTGLLFVGGARHPPNVDGVRWLLNEVVPLLSRMQDDTTLLHLVGAGLQDALSDLVLPARVVVHGHVPDLRPLLQGCRVGLAPLRFGAGVKGKINQYLAHGLPTVATACAAEAMHLTDGEDVLLADTAGDFAQAVANLHRNEELWNRLSRNGVDNIRTHFSEEAMLPALTRSFAGIVVPVASPAPLPADPD